MVRSKFFFTACLTKSYLLRLPLYVPQGTTHLLSREKDTFEIFRKIQYSMAHIGYYVLRTVLRIGQSSTSITSGQKKGRQTPIDMQARRQGPSLPDRSLIKKLLNQTSKPATS
jgi:hypothetical protein